jgi:hypothetical protein
MFGVVARFLDIYQRTNAAAAPTTAAPLVSRMYGGVLDNTYLQAIALTDLHLHLNYISPLTTLKLQRYARWRQYSFYLLIICYFAFIIYHLLFVIICYLLFFVVISNC